jgi:hypothetical protein
VELGCGVSECSMDPRYSQKEEIGCSMDPGDPQKEDVDCSSDPRDPRTRDLDVSVLRHSRGLGNAPATQGITRRRRCGLI